MTLSQDILKKMLELPNRLSGTVYEQKAGEYLKSVYNYFGVQTKEFDSPTLKDSLVNHLIISFALIILTVLVNFLNIVFITLPFFVITVLVYFRLFNIPFRFIKKRTISKNIYAEIPSKLETKYTLVITSHYDTSTDMGAIFGILGPIYTYLNFSNPNSTLTIPDYINNPLIISNVALALTLLALFLPDNSAKFFFGIITAVPLAIGIYLLQKGKRKLPVGAIDNGVASSLLVELASKFSKAPLNNTKIIFANVAAEQTLTKGTLPLLNSLNLDKSKTFILNLGSIGEEEIVLLNSEPSYPLGLDVPYDSSFEVLADFAEDFLQKGYKVLNSPLPSSNQNLVYAGYRVMGMLITMPSVGYSHTFHSVRDTLDKVKWDKVELVRDFLDAYITYFDDLSTQVNI